jgi:hypothetical protein
MTFVEALIDGQCALRHPRVLENSLDSYRVWSQWAPSPTPIPIGHSFIGFCYIPIYVYCNDLHHNGRLIDITTSFKITLHHSFRSTNTLQLFPLDENARHSFLRFRAACHLCLVSQARIWPETRMPPDLTWITADHYSPVRWLLNRLSAPNPFAISAQRLETLWAGSHPRRPARCLRHGQPPRLLPDPDLPDRLLPQDHPGRPL